MANIEGLEELRGFIRRFPIRTQQAAKRGMTTGAIRVQRAARGNLKPNDQGGGVDRGQLRQSITYLVQYVVNGVIGYVGSNKSYAPHVEFGTRPHWPPLAALEAWARRHGTTAMAVAYAISLRGTPARKFLGKAVEEQQAAVVNDIVAAIRAEMGRK